MSLTGRILEGAAGRIGVLPRRAGALALTLALAAPALLLAGWPAATAQLEYDRERIAAGETWRLVTCHWTHWTWNQTLLDLAGFAVPLLLCLGASRRRTGWALGASCVAIPSAVWIGLPEMVRYRGLSGLDSALFVLLGLLLLKRPAVRRDPRLAWAVGLALTCFAAKVAFEIASGTTAFADDATFVPVPLAHLVGAACGALAAIGGKPLADRSAHRTSVARATPAGLDGRCARSARAERSLRGNA